MSEESLNREVDLIDIAYDEYPIKHYKPAEDLTKFKSEKTERCPLEKGWIENTTPIMTSYKVIRVSFEVWGLQTKVEDFVHRVRIEFFNKSVSCHQGSVKSLFDCRFKFLNFT